LCELTIGDHVVIAITDVAGRLRASVRRPAAKRFYGEFVRPGDLVFDVGANVGDRTAVFRALGARVVAVEPQSFCLDRLRKVFGADPNVHIVAAGLAASPGTMELSICDAAPTISTMSTTWRDAGRFANSHQWTRTETVPVTTLDALIDEYGTPAFCKIDVEGFELSVIEGLSRPLRCLSFEFAREFMEQTSACMRRLADLGGYRFNVSLGESMRFALADNIAADDLFSFLSSHTDPLLWGDVYAFDSGSVAD
jgi:FkbM family methyltransferase